MYSQDLRYLNEFFYLNNFSQCNLEINTQNFNQILLQTSESLYKNLRKCHIFYENDPHIEAIIVFYSIIENYQVVCVNNFCGIMKKIPAIFGFSILKIF